MRCPRTATVVTVAVVVAVVVAAVVAGGVGIRVAAASAGAKDGATAGASRARTVAVAEAPAPATPLVLVSGRDDHGELASADVPLYSAAGGHEPVGRVRDGTLARVVAVEGTWLQVRTVEGPPLEGWLDDFYLRRQLHLLGPGPTCRVRVGAHLLAAGEQAVVLEVSGDRARVALVRPPVDGWVPRADVREIPPRQGCGADRVPSAPRHGHHD